MWTASCKQQTAADHKAASRPGAASRATNVGSHVFCCCIFSFFSSSFPSSCLFFVFLFLLFCFQRCVSSSRSNNAGQRTTDHMFHEHTDCSRQGEESSFVSDLTFTFRFSPSVYFFVIACFLFDSLLFTETHTYGSEEMVGFVRLGDVREESSFV